MVYSLALLFSAGKPKPATDKKISVLVAARNEEDNILRCLFALNRLDYPAENIEFLIGNDGSNDLTGAYILDFIKDKPGWTYVFVKEKLNGQKGKQNVLAQLALQAKGEILLVTDADIAVKPTWAKTLVGAMRFSGDKYAFPFVSGPTLVEGNGLFSKMQSLDWMMGMAIAGAHARLGIPLTGVGNNMAISRNAYLETGGYENMRFSITEDYELFREVCEKRNHPFLQVFHPSALNISKPIKDFSGLMKQRKRWFRGSFDLAWYNLALMFFNALIMPVIISSWFFVSFEVFCQTYLIKLIADFVFLLVAALLLRKPLWMIYFPLYELYYQFMVFLTPLLQLIPTKIEWKGRKYS